MGITLALLLVCVQAEPEPTVTVTYGSYDGRAESGVKLAEDVNYPHGLKRTSTRWKRQTDRDLRDLLATGGLVSASSHSNATVEGAYGESSLCSTSFFDVDVQRPGVHAGTQINFDAWVTEPRPMQVLFTGRSITRAGLGFAPNEPQNLTQFVRIHGRIELSAHSNTPTLLLMPVILTGDFGKSKMKASWNPTTPAWDISGSRVSGGKTHPINEVLGKEDLGVKAELKHFHSLGTWAVDVDEIVSLEEFLKNFYIRAHTQTMDILPEHVQLFSQLTDGHRAESLDVCLEVRVYCTRITPVNGNDPDITSHDAPTLPLAPRYPLAVDHDPL